MTNQQLIDYIKNQLKLGRSEDVIKSMLKSAGWQDNDIEEGFKVVSGQSVSTPTPSPSLSSFVSASSNVLPGGWELLKQSWRIYKNRFWTLVGIVIIPAVIWLIIGGLIFLSGIKSGAGIDGLNLLIIISVVILGIISIVLSVWAGAALFYAVANETFSLKEAFRQAWQKRIVSFVWVGLLMGLITMGGFVLGVIPSIIFWIWFIVSQFVFVVEGQKEFNALLRSKEYVSGRWWKVFWRMIVFGLITLIVGLISSGLSFGAGLIYKPASIVSSLVNILFGPFTVVYLFSLYTALRQTRPELANQPVAAKKGFFVFCAILGILAPIIIVITIIIFTNIIGKNSNNTFNIEYNNLKNEFGQPIITEDNEYLTPETERYIRGY